MQMHLITDKTLTLKKTLGTTIWHDRFYCTGLRPDNLKGENNEYLQ